MHIPQMNEWRSSGKFTDIVIEIHGRKFDCHRVALASASEFFATMLGSSFPESTADTVPLQDVVKADTFVYVLQFIYTGDVVLTTENVCPLLIAADYLKLDPQLERKCSSFIENNLPIEHMFDAIKFASMSSRASLLYHIVYYISCHLENFCDISDDFLELPFEVIKMIIDLSALKEEIVVKATMQWINHKRGDRWQYFSQLSHLGMMAGVAFTEIESMAQSIVPDGISNENVASFLDKLKRRSIDETLRVSWIEKLSNKILEVSIHHTVQCKMFQTPPGFAGMKKVVFDTSLIYSLNFTSFDWLDKYGMLEFCSHTSDGVMLNTLKSPHPKSIRSNYFFHNLIQMCGLPKINRIYFFMFNIDEYLLRAYHCDTGMWDTLETANDRPKTWPLMAACETSNRVYFIFRNWDSGPYTVYVHDCCTLKWTKLPKSNHTLKSPLWPAACVFEGKLYIYNKSYGKYEIYDPTTQKWCVSQQNPYVTDALRYPCVVPYGGALWLFYEAESGQNDEQTKNSYIVYLYRLESDSWHKYPLIRAAIEKYENINNHEPCFLYANVS